MAQCPRCGNVLAEGTRFCTGCGADLSAAGAPPMGGTSVMPPVAPPVPAPYAPQPAYPSPSGAYPPPATPSAPKRSGCTVVAIVAAVLGVLLLCCGVGGFFGYRYYLDQKKAGAAGGAGRDASDEGVDSSGAEEGSSTGGEATGGTAGGTAGGTTGGTTTTGGGPPSTAAEDISMLADLSASSTLRGSSKADYVVTNLVDGDSTTCWAEGAAAYGPGQRVRFTFPREVWVSKVRIIPGYDKYDYDRSVDRWWSNGRVKGARLHFSDGQETGVFALSEEERGLQDMTLAAPKKTSFVEFEIIWAYPANTGTRHDAQDTSVSEMRVEGWAE